MIWNDKHRYIHLNSSYFCCLMTIGLSVQYHAWLYFSSVWKSPIYTLHLKWNEQAATWLMFKFSAVQASLVYIGPKYDTVTYACLIKFKGTNIYYTEWVNKYYTKEYLFAYLHYISCHKILLCVQIHLFLFSPNCL